MAEFSILDHLDKLTPDEGSAPKGSRSFYCPVCNAKNFKVELKSGKYNTFTCDCAATESGKRKIRAAIEPPINPNAENKPTRFKQERCWQYFTPLSLENGQPALEVHRLDDGNGGRKIWQKSLVTGRTAAEVKDRVLPYGLQDALQALADGAPYVFWVEGEPCVDALRELDLYAITSIGGAGKFNLERDGGHIPPDRLVVVPDRDKPGLKHAQAVADAHPGCQWLFPFPGTAQWNGSCPTDKGLDIADWIATGATVEQIIAGVCSKPVAEPKGVAQGDLDLASYSDLLDAILDAIRASNEDTEMLARAELKNRYRVSDDQINTALFKRLSQGKVEAVKPKHDSIVMADVEMLHYQLDGWIQQGDIGLTYGSFGCGKTTLAIWKAYNAAKGLNILDRSTPCTPIKSLIIATDSGLGPLYKSFDDLGIDPATDPLLIPGHSDQMIYIWGHDPAQGHGAWICDIHGIIRLEKFIQKHGIGYVAIDSAKSVSSAAGWSYTSNEAVKALLKHLREAVTKPLGCFIEFLSHDGTEKGSHSGAKAWAEDPSMVCYLQVQKDADSGTESVLAQFKKDRAAAIDPRRQVTYFLQDQQLKLAPLAEVIGNCDDAILTVLWDAHCNGTGALRTAALMDEVFTRFKKTRKTVENSLPALKNRKAPRIISPRRGFYALAPGEIQRREVDSADPLIGLHLKRGGELVDPLQRNGSANPPTNPPMPFSGGTQSPQGETPGGYQTPATATDLPNPPPEIGGHPPSDNDPLDFSSLPF